jgi:HEAT repeat protein
MNTPTDIANALKSTNDSQRADALKAARTAGAAAVPAIAPLLADPQTETRRAAKRALSSIVYAAGHDGRLGKPAAQAEQALITALSQLTDTQARRDVAWLLSEIGDGPTVKALATLLTHPDLREDARCTLERIPGRVSLNTLKSAFKTSPEDFKYALADSLRKRGETVRDYPSKRLTPLKPTTVRTST